MPVRLNSAAFICFLAALVAASVAPAQPKTPEAETPKAVAHASGDVDLARSRVYIFVGKKGRLGHEHGVVGKLKSGHVSLGDPKNAGEMVFDMASFLADTKEARRYVGLGGETDAGTQQQVTDNMLSGNVLSVKKHPTAKFVIKSVQKMKATKPDEAPKYQLDGEFTLFGTTQPLSLVSLAEEYEGQTRLRCTFTIQQTDYGIRPYSMGFGAVGVSNELKIWGDVLLHP